MVRMRALKRFHWGASGQPRGALLRHRAPVGRPCILFFRQNQQMVISLRPYYDDWHTFLWLRVALQAPQPSADEALARRFPLAFAMGRIIRQALVFRFSVGPSIT